jgi:CobQ-like glutamine amidotransferase family enzyme
MTLIRLGAFYHEQLNLNGDVMNLMVLSKRLNWLGFEVEVVDLTTQNILEQLALGVDFALLGHGSTAAWSQLLQKKEELASAFGELVKQQVPLFAVSSGFQVMVDLGIINEPYEKVERSSKFSVSTFAGNELLGYVNTDTNLPIFSNYGAATGTLLHGPVLAKNPWLADQIIETLLTRRGLVVGNSSWTSRFEHVNLALEGVWRLERELANE